MIGRSLAGALLGFPLAALLLRLALHVFPHGGADWIIPALILFFPLWMALLTAAFAFRNTWRVCAVFGCANVATLLLVRALG